MKKLVLGLAAVLALTAASPTFARPVYTSRHAIQIQRLDGVRAQAMRANPVFDDGHYVGTDPDPNVQLQLRRDSGLFDR